MRPNLELPDTKLSVFDDEIVRTAEDNKSTLLRLPITELESASSYRAINPFGIVMIASGLGIFAIGWELVESNTLACLMYVFAFLLAMFGMTCIIEARLVLNFKDKRHVISPTEGIDVVEGFAYSLNLQLKSGKPLSDQEAKAS